MPDNLIYAGSRHRIRRWRNYGITSSPPVAPVEFLFRDDFITAEAAPLTSPRIAEPGPGELTIVQPNSLFSISGEAWQVAAGVGQADFGTFPVTRNPGLVYHSILTRNAGQLRIGFGAAAAVSPTELSLRVVNNADIRSLVNGVLLAGLFSSGSPNFESFLICRSSGGFIVENDSSTYLLAFVYVDGNTAPLFAHALGTHDAAGKGLQDTMRVSQLPSPWDTDFGIATDRLAGARGAGDRYTHEADFIGEFIVTTVPGAGTIFWTFREQDATNYWEVIIEPSQDLTLREVVAGVPVARGVAVGVVNNGDRIVVIAEGTTIRVYEQNTLRITYALAANFQTETDGELLAIGTGAVDDIVLWPRVISGAARRALDRVADA